MLTSKSTINGGAIKTKNGGKRSNKKPTEAHPAQPSAWYSGEWAILAPSRATPVDIDHPWPLPDHILDVSPADASSPDNPLSGILLFQCNSVSIES